MTKQPVVSLIVSSYKQPDHLSCCLYSLKTQLFTDFEVIVTENGDEADYKEARMRVEGLGDVRFSILHTGPQSIFHPGAKSCYYSAEMAVPYTSGRYLGFPSSDGYYTPWFLKRMVEYGEKIDADLLYCDMLYEIADGKEYMIVRTAATHKAIDKTCFLVKRGLFSAFPDKDHERAESDGLFIQGLMDRGGIRVMKVQDILVIHN